MNSNQERAQIIVEALPYIQKFTGKVIVIKYGGNAMISEELFEAVIEDMIMLRLVGIHAVLVHGGGAEINDMLDKMGIEPRFVNGLRYTDEATMEIVQSVLCGKVNKDLVAIIIRKGGSAIGLCGLDSKLYEAKKLNRGDGLDYGLVGDITEVNPKVVREAIEDGHIPVVATVAYGVDNAAVYNINADTAAAKLAIALGAEKLILLTNARGILRDKDDEDSLIKQIKAGDTDELAAQGIISDGMLPKVECCKEAIDGGVKRTHILDGRIAHSILIELFTDEGAGTMID